MNFFGIKAFLYIFVVLASTCINTKAQERTLTLDQALSFANNSFSYKKIKNDSIINDLKHKMLRNSILPNIQINSEFPGYDKSISLVSQYDGSFKYRSRTYASSSINFNVSQLIPFTGGTIKYILGLNRLDNLNNADKTYAYYFNLGNISYSQTLFSYNSYKWAKRKDSQEKIVEDIYYRQEKEKTKFKLVNAFFDLLVQQKNKELLEKNLELSRYVYNKCYAFYQQKLISEMDLCTAEIEYIGDSISNDETDVEVAINRINNLLGFSQSTCIHAILEDTLNYKPLDIDVSKITDRFAKYNYDETYKLKEIEQSLELKRNKSEKRPKITLDLSSGLNTQFENFRDSFSDKLSSRKILVSICIPIFDGGLANSKYEIAKLKLHELYEQSEYERKESRIEIVKDLSTINRIVNSINIHKNTLNILERQMSNIHILLDHERVDIEQIIRVKSQYTKSYIAYLELIRSYYLLIYKYRYTSLYDIELGKEL